MILDAWVVLVGSFLFFCIHGAEGGPCPSVAVDLNITTMTDVQDLSDAIDCSGQGIFDITWHISLTIGQVIDVSNQKTVTVTGSGFPTISSGIYYRDGAGSFVDLGTITGIFSVSNGSTLSLKQVVLEGGYSEEGGAIAVYSSSSLYVVDCGFTNNRALNGGAVYASNSEVYIDGMTEFANNSAGTGGSLYALDSEVHIDGDSVFAHSSADWGGAIFAKSSNVSVDGNTMFTHNSAEKDGGGIYAILSDVTIDGRANFSYNYAGDDGGAIYVPDSKIGFDGCVRFTHNSAVTSGGALCAYGSNISMNATMDFVENSAGVYGGGIYASQSTEAYLDNRTYFQLNSADSGGSICVFESKVYINGCAEFDNNSAVWYGGAVYASTFAEVYLDGITSFAHNMATSGGGFSSFHSSVYMTGNTDFSSNLAKSDGGAMYVSQHSGIHMDGNTLFARNSAEFGGAILAYSSNFSISSGTVRTGNASNDQGVTGVETGFDTHFTRSVAFVENKASKGGGAMYIIGTDLFHVSYTMFRSNRADFGGAVYIASTEGKATEFSQCMFEGNAASDGGALYLYTGAGVDIITTSIFSDNFAKYSGGAIFHTGSLRLTSTSLVANAAGAEGTAVFSIGILEELINVAFSHNSNFCPVGQYGYTVKHHGNQCRLCFDQVCSRCSAADDDGVLNAKDVEVDGLSVCGEAPSGSTAPTSGTTVATLTLDQGYYRTSNQSHVVLECYRKEACKGGDDAGNYCASGYKGPYCAVCAEGFAPGITYSCHKCSPSVRRSAAGVAVGVGLAAFLMAALLLSYLGSPGKATAGDDVENAARGLRGEKCIDWQTLVVNMLPLTAIKIVVTVWQIISQFAAIAGDVYPEGYTNFVAKLIPINFDIGTFLSYSCMVTTDFYDRLVISTITPLVLFLALAGSYVVGKKRNRGSEAGIRLVRQRHQSAALFLLFLIYSSVSYTIFQTFSCDDLVDGKSFLRADYSLECYTHRNDVYKAYALVMACVYPVGIPVVFTWCLARHRRDLVKPNREEMAHLEPLNTIWGAYRPSRYYFEVVECGRRISLTAIAAFVLPNSTAQISIVLLFAVVYVFISEALSPFKKAVDMSLYRWGNGIIVASLYVAFLLKVDIETKQSSSAFSSVLVAANVFMLVVVLVEMVILVIGWYGANTAVREVEAPISRTTSRSLGLDGSLSEGGAPWPRRRDITDAEGEEKESMRNENGSHLPRPFELCSDLRSTRRLQDSDVLGVGCGRCKATRTRANTW